MKTQNTADQTDISTTKEKRASNGWMGRAQNFRGSPTGGPCRAIARDKSMDNRKPDVPGWLLIGVPRARGGRSIRWRILEPKRLK